MVRGRGSGWWEEEGGGGGRRRRWEGGGDGELLHIGCCDYE